MTVTQKFRDALINLGIDGAKIDVVTDGVDLSHFVLQAKVVTQVQQLYFKTCLLPAISAHTGWPMH